MYLGQQTIEIPAEPPSALAGHRHIGDGGGREQEKVSQCDKEFNYSQSARVVLAERRHKCVGFSEILHNVVAGGSQASRNCHVKMPFKTF
jgi:hypothetical protein